MTTRNPFRLLAKHHFPGILDQAVPADEWEQAGQEWEPDAQVIANPIDNFHFPQVRECLRQHSSGIVSYAIVRLFDSDTLSVELQFASATEKNAFLKTYGKVRLHKPKSPSSGTVKRLFRNRMYILPDGREFWLHYKWDNSRRIGKVVADRLPDGRLELANEIVDDAVLRRCELIPKGQEPWRPDPT